MYIFIYLYIYIAIYMYIYIIYIHTYIHTYIQIVKEINSLSTYSLELIIWLSKVNLAKVRSPTRTEPMELTRTDGIRQLRVLC